MTSSGRKTKNRLDDAVGDDIMKWNPCPIWTIIVYMDRGRIFNREYSRWMQDFKKDHIFREIMDTKQQFIDMNYGRLSETNFIRLHFRG